MNARTRTTLFLLASIALHFLCAALSPASAQERTKVVPRSSFGRAIGAVSGEFSPMRGIVVSANLYDLRSGRTSQEIQRAVNEGITLFRTDLFWGAIEPSRGEFDFTTTDSLVHAILDNGGRCFPSD